LAFASPPTRKGGERELYRLIEIKKRKPDQFRLAGSKEKRGHRLSTTPGSAKKGGGEKEDFSFLDEKGGGGTGPSLLAVDMQRKKKREKEENQSLFRSYTRRRRRRGYLYLYLPVGGLKKERGVREKVEPLPLLAQKKKSALSPYACRRRANRKRGDSLSTFEQKERGRSLIPLPEAVRIKKKREKKTKSLSPISRDAR